MKEIDEKSEVGKIGQLMMATLCRIGKSFGGDDLVIMHRSGLTLPQLIALSSLRQHGPLSVSQIAEFTHLSAAAASYLVDRLVELGYVIRSEDAIDRRKKKLRLSRTGRSLVDKLDKARLEVFTRAVCALSIQTRRRLSEVLNEVISEMEVER